MKDILKDEDVFIVEDSQISLGVIKVPRADYKMRPVYVGENPYKGIFKRNNEGDYTCGLPVRCGYAKSNQAR